MRTRSLAIVQLALILPAALFMTSLVVRHLGAPQVAPAHVAQQIVMWYAARLWTLWLLLFALPCAVLISGCAALRARYRDGAGQGTRGPPASIRAHWSARFVAVTTAASAGILAIVAFHVLTD